MGSGVMHILTAGLYDRGDRELNKVSRKLIRDSDRLIRVIKSNCPRDRVADASN